MQIQIDEGIRTLTGAMFDYADPGRTDINIRDIAYPLSNNCRFAGHLPWHYSVAQHCVNVSRLVDDEHAFTALMHDTSEAFTNDITTPLKRRVPGFKDLEIAIETEMAIQFGFAFPLPEAVKYADLSQNRQSDYVFSWDRMLALEGNTAPYLMYAYARVRSIYRKGAETQAGVNDGAVTIGPPASIRTASASESAASGSANSGEPAERALALRIARFAETIDGVAAGLRINLLTDYLYELSGAFMKFYESCPVLGADTPQQRASRLKLCDLTARTLRVGLDLLGIRVLERM